MAWVFLVDGNHYKKTGVESDAAYALSEAIEKDPSYLAIKSEVEQNGMIINFCVDMDSDSISCYFGYELYRPRHIYQGQTVSAKPVENRDNALLEKLHESLFKLLTAHGFEIVNSGIVLSCFD